MKGLKTGGREKGTPNKATASLKEAAQAHTETAINTIIELMAEGNSAPTRLAAAGALLDRGHGKPQQVLPVSDPSELLERIIAFVAEKHTDHVQIFSNVLEEFGKTAGATNADLRPKTTAIKIDWGD